MRGNEEVLLAGLKAMARAETRGPSVGLETRLLAELPGRRVPWGTFATTGAIAAGICIAVVLWPALWPAPEERLVSALRTPVVPDIAPDIVYPAASSAQVKPAPRRKAEPAALRYELITIPYAEPLQSTERAELVRVRIPVSELVAWGLPLRAADPDTRVDADVLLGEDGLARAVRFIR